MSAIVHGTVSDATGSVIAGTHVELTDRDGRVVRHATTDSLGRFSLPSVTSGSYILATTSKGFAPLHKAITVAGEDLQLALILSVASETQTVNVSEPSAYVATSAIAGTKVDLPLMETPVAVAVIPQQVLRDQQTVSLVNALTNVSGVAPTNDGYGTSDSFSIRGFDAMSLLYQDGMKLDEYSTSGFPQDMANVEEVQVVKGPASVLYGQAEPGGLVEVITKKPHPNHFGSLEQQFGNHRFFRTVADFNQPLVKDRLWLRVVASGTDADSYRNFVHNNDFNLYPSITWRPSKLMDLTVHGTYQNGSEVLDNGIPFVQTGPDSGSPAKVPFSSNFVDYGANKSPTKVWAVRPVVTIHLAERWPLRVQYKHEYHNAPTPIDEVYFGDVDASGNLFRFGFTEDYFHHSSHQVVADQSGKFSTGRIKHTVLFGFDYYTDAGDYSYNMVNPQTINIYAPVYDQGWGTADPTTEGSNTLGQNEYGFYAQDVAELPGRFFVMGGLRKNWAEEWENYADYTHTVYYKQYVKDTPITPRAGLVWRATPHVSLYGSYTSNYGASSLSGPGQKLLPPQSANQVEFGVKSEWLDRRLTASTAIYRIIKHNVPTPDPTNPAISEAIGTARTQGVEFDVAGQVTRTLRIIAGYSNLQSLVTRDYNTPSEQGHPFGSTPHSMGSLWATWEPQAQRVRGLKLGAGVQSRSGEQAYEYAGTLITDRIPHFAIVSLMTGYERALGKAHVSAQVNVNNLLNKKYFSNVNPSQAMPGAPFSILPALQVRF